jgi:hypothetical protein
VYRRHFTDTVLEAAPTTPGMKYRHYSPAAPVTLLDFAGWVPDVAAAADTWADGGGASTSSTGAGRQNGGALTGPTQVVGGEAAPLAALRHRADAAVRQLVRQQCDDLLQQRQASGTPQCLDAMQQHNGDSLGMPAHNTRERPLVLVVVLRTTLALSSSGELLANPGGCLLCEVADVQRSMSTLATAPTFAAGEANAAAAYGCDPAHCEVLEWVLGDVAVPEGAARRLFAALRAADEAGAAAIVAEGVLEAGQGTAVMNRLRKAASRVVLLHS